MEFSVEQVKFAVEQTLGFMADKAGCTGEDVARAVLTGECNPGVTKNFASIVALGLEVIAKGPEVVKQELLAKAAA